MSGLSLRVISVGLASSAVCSCLLLCGCPRPDPADPIRVVVQDEPETGAEQSPGDVAQLARREGELAWYTSLPEEPATEFLRLFREKHPYLTTRLVRGSTFDIIQGVEAEIQAGRVQADVLHVLDVAAFVQLRKQGRLLRYTCPQERYIPVRYKDSGFWWALRCVDICIAYDSARLEPGEAPQTWMDLLEPRWVGRVAMKDAQTAGSAYAQYYFLREEYGISYWRRMAGQRPQVYKTAEECMAAVQAGTAEIFSGAMGYSLYEEQPQGSTIRGIWPADGVPMMLGPVAILRAAPHRHAAKLFVDFALSRDGQVALRDLLGAYSPRDDVPAQPGRPELGALNVMTPTGGWEEYAERQEALRPEYTSLFHPGSE